MGSHGDEVMRIAVNASLLDEKPGGLGVYTENVLRELSHLMGEKHRYTIYTSYRDNLARSCSNQTRFRDTPKFLQPKFGEKAALARFAWSLLILPRLVRDDDLLYSPTHHGVLFGGVDQIITVHDVLPLKFPSQYRLQHYYFKVALPRLANRSAAIVTDSESTRQDLHRHLGIPFERIHVIHPGVDQRFQAAASHLRNKTASDRHALKEFFLIVGASYPHKNISRALQAFRTLQAELPHFKLVIAGGRPPYHERLKREARQLGATNITFLNYVSTSQLASLYGTARALLYPSLYEGFGLPPLEAMMCGCPVIAGNTSSVPEVCGDAAYYVDPSKEESLAKAMLLLATDEDAGRLLREKGWQRVQSFSWERTARQIYGVLENVYRRRRGSA